jgi:hypothetical protein
MNKVENAEIESTVLGDEDHGVFTCYVFVSGDGWGCGFGGYALDEYNKEKKERIGTAYGLEFIKRILKTLEISTWEKLKGTPVRVETTGIGGKIARIGHFRKDRWFDPQELLAEMKEENQ